MLSISNQKLDIDGIASFGLPPKITCIGSSEDCERSCFACNGRFIFPAVKAKLLKNYELSMDDSFVDRMVGEIYLNIDHIKHFRIHTSGDFYSKEYRNKWYQICEKFKSIKFYAYTKAIPLFVDSDCNIEKIKPKNLTIIYSYGGKYDDLILYGSRHCHIFRTRSELKKAGYICANDSDLRVFSSNNKIGLVYHGVKSKELVTWKGGK